MRKQCKKKGSHTVPNGNMRHAYESRSRSTAITLVLVKFGFDTGNDRHDVILPGLETITGLCLISPNDAT